ncbi:hypothetical protein [Pseudolysinimonas kribbensis]|uniref:hypothetical protein n=1 Tax=Pseudolysinimonas kribbensis TaxID=433641 RepID=UPI0024E08D42|nr:hypothetical protein [Pseudolysinimonas kribbensis]
MLREIAQHLERHLLAVRELQHVAVAVLPSSRSSADGRPAVSWMSKRFLEAVHWMAGRPSTMTVGIPFTIVSTPFGTAWRIVSRSRSSSTLTSGGNPPMYCSTVLAAAMLRGYRAQRQHRRALRPPSSS